MLKYYKLVFWKTLAKIWGIDACIVYIVFTTNNNKYIYIYLNQHIYCSWASKVRILNKKMSIERNKNNEHKIDVNWT